MTAFSLLFLVQPHLLFFSVFIFGSEMAGMRPIIKRFWSFSSSTFSDLLLMNFCIAGDKLMGLEFRLEMADLFALSLYLWFFGREESTDLGWSPIETITKFELVVFWFYVVVHIISSWFYIHENKTWSCWWAPLKIK